MQHRCRHRLPVGSRAMPRGSTSLPHICPAASSSCCGTRSTRTGSRRSGRRWTRSSAELAERRRRAARARALERDGRAAPRARRARDRPRRRGRLLVADVLRERERDPLRRGDARSSSTPTRRPGRSTPSSSTARSPSGRRSRPSSPSTSTGSAATTTRSRRSARGTAWRSSRTRPSRSARPTSGAPAGGQGDARGLLVQRQQGDHDERRRDARLRRRATGSSTRASSRRRRASPRRTTSTPRSGSTTGLSNLLAAVGRAQLEVLPERVAARRRINARYRELLAGAGSSSCRRRAYGRSNCWLTCILVDPRGRHRPRAIRLALEAEDIESRPLWKPMHLQPFSADAPGLRRRRVGRAVRARALPAERARR